jgi:hypothetical protein
VLGRRRALADLIGGTDDPRRFADACGALGLLGYMVGLLATGGGSRAS